MALGPRTAQLTRVAWPGGARCAVTLSFDVDAESGYLCCGQEYARRLSSLSQGRYGIRRGLPRLLDLLDKHGLHATFFVPGYTLELPVQWLLDDWPPFAYDGDGGSPPAAPEAVYQIWAAEFEGLYAEGGYFLLTMHPEVIGRPHRLALLERLIAHIAAQPGVRWATAEEVARHNVFHRRHGMGIPTIPRGRDRAPAPLGSWS